MKKILVIGSLNQDCVVQVDHAARTGETVLTSGAQYFPGGKGANQAYAIGKLGNSYVRMLGAVGQDEAGRFLTDNLAKVQVDVSRILQDPNHETGQAWISVDKNGNNSITVLQGANQAVTPAYIDVNLDSIQWSDIVVMQLEIPLETVTYVAKLAKQMGKMVFLDPAPAAENLPEELLACTDLIKPNQTEAAIITGTPEEADNHLRQAALLRKKGIGTVIISLGGNGVLVDSAEAGIFSMPCVQVKAVDTTAAGDSFLAALTLSLSRDNTLRQAVAFAQKVAAITVTRRGAQTSIPSAEEVAAL